MQEHLRRNFCMHIMDGTFFFLAMALISINTVLPVMLNRLGATAFIIGMLPFIDTLVFNLTPLFTAHLAEKVHNKKRYVLIVAFAQRLTVLLAGIALIFCGKYRPDLIIPAVFLFVAAFGISSGFIIPAWADLVGRTISKEIRGRMFSIRNVLGYLLAIGGSAFIAWVLTAVAFPASYIVLFFTAYALMLISFTGLAFVKDCTNGDQPTHAPTFIAYLHEAYRMLKGNRNYLYFNIARCFIVFGFGTTAFFSAYGMKKFDLPDSYAGVFTGVSVATYIILSPVMGWWGDKKGNKQPVVFAQAMTGVAAAAAIYATTIKLYLIVFVAITMVQVAIFMTVLNLTLEFFTPEKRPTTIAISSAFTAPVAIVVLLLGKCAEVAGYNAIFYTIIAFSIAATLFTAFWLKDPRHDTDTHTD